MTLKIGDTAPDFELKDQSGNDFSLSKYIGKENILIYFYPKNETPGCTKEACTFRDNIEQFKGLNCKVIGISSDSEANHKQFAKNHNLPFTLLSDRKNKVRKLFGVKAAIPGILPGRKTYLINKNGIICHISEYQFKPLLHVQEALKALEDVE